MMIVYQLQLIRLEVVLGVQLASTWGYMDIVVDYHSG